MGGITWWGVPAAMPWLFEGVAWSTREVLAETVRRLEAAGVGFGLVEALGDVDTPEDLVSFPGLAGELAPHAIRAGRDEDAGRFIALIGRCWADYPGCVLDVEREEPELLALASAYAAKGGALWVAGDGVGMAAVRPLAASWEICRVYVHPALHGSGLGAALMDVAEGHAVAAGARVLELWSDTRFERAHRFYAKRGYVRGELRALGDLSGTEEWRFVRVV